MDLRQGTEDKASAIVKLQTVVVDQNLIRKLLKFCYYPCTKRGPPSGLSGRQTVGGYEQISFYLSAYDGWCHVKECHD